MSLGGERQERTICKEELDTVGLDVHGLHRGGVNGNGAAADGGHCDVVALALERVVWLCNGLRPAAALHACGQAIL